MDGLRGIGAVQVCLCHLLAALGFVRPFGPELIVMDGSLAVFVFFFISGYVLTASYERSSAAPTTLIISRMIRLFLPAVAASFFAFGVWTVLQYTSPQDVAALPAQGADAKTFISFLSDAFVVTPLLGHKSSSFFLGLPYLGDLVRGTTSASFVLWTINIEFLGSLVVIGLCRAGHHGKWLAVLAAFVLLRSLLLPFALGYLLRSAPLLRFRYSLVVFAGLLAVAFWLSLLASNGEFLWFARKIAGLRHLVPAQSAFSVQKCAAALLIFVGVLACWRARVVLASRPAVWLGRISFPLYLTHAALIPVFVAVAAAAQSQVWGLVAFVVLLAPSIWLFSWIDALSIRWSKPKADNARRRDSEEETAAQPSAA